MLVNYDRIKGLVYTEKSNKQLADGKYYFRVDASCDKKEVASLIKKSFGVEVEKVNIINTAGKTKRFKGVLGTKSPYKKAVVTLKKGQSINFA
ncbi:MAG: 50S ribosomal protein L23 [Alphaproteobacteria bacterium RIFCSPLOWO2_01_FULL_40_26]|nr:MAG: 50S ribosomal protein L23 [Alphaproteobacteria bacterium RIFCSPHIGHO2_02_FULL_40_34]OFW87843.1 MAG: 50S ribosomal protein L23 [Alphaproteobacteria bacterium RIFCSPHIGHO2_01_FULL_40_8]OFW95078.1 MAG: 50S ribosomal protein L23 [Alphaproteobacteria bacterium RIFCSPLOWO2_01_FULL_40_26]OFX09099.1 MAG: 50S ribosomal protein L23 [Alphaproteobacteria bacterium RIFCSPLOWO2_02_FULL_40_19]OFX12159.1 MAG: 50S ribosomal protein L23 [Alphaproteobacteria bacterium RIFCSPLOWO2_12_FULL_40_11]